MRVVAGKLIGVVGQLLSPFRYCMFINSGKFQVDFIFPLLVTLLTYWLFSKVPGGVPLLGKDGFVAAINGLLQILTGFFVAGLAAIFGSPGVSLDQKPIGFKYVGPLRRDAELGAAITRRVLLCALFGYLAFVSFALYLMGVIANLCAPLIAGLPWKSVLRPALAFPYIFVVWNIFFVTIYGLYYMIDRAHRADPVVVSGPKSD